MRIVADKLGVARLQAALEQLSDLTEDPREMFEEVSVSAAYPAVQEIFDNEGYGAWASVTDEYARRKDRSIYAGMPLLQRTTDLKLSLTGRDNAGSVHEFDADGSLVIGSDLPYFGVQNDARPIAQFQPHHYDDMEDAAVEHIARAGRSAGFEVTTE